VLPACDDAAIGGAADAASGGAGGDDTGSSSGGSVTVAPTCNGPGEASTPIDTALPSLPELGNLRACTSGDAVSVTFDPVDGAVDYRIYALPADDAIETGPDGTVVIENTLYRCAGHREGLYMLVDVQPNDEGWNDNSAGGMTIVNGDVQGFVRSDADATLGHVYTTEGEGRVPVHVLGVGDAEADGGLGCGRAIFNSTRPKIYTTDAAERDALIAAHARDDGIAFYVPSAGTSGTQPVYEGTVGDATLRWNDGAEGSQRAGQGAPIFDVLASPAEGTVPLMRVHVIPYCSPTHDELVAGSARYAKVRSEGDHPLTALRWSGLTQETVLVVEALDQGCPYQGNLAPGHEEPFIETYGDVTMEFEAFLTVEDMRLASPTGEVFVNGQHDAASVPHATHRSLLRVAPSDPPALDFYATFPETDDLRAAFGEPAGTVYAMHYPSELYDFSTYNASHIQFGTMLGEFWATYNDIAADTNGKVRLTPHQTATLGDEDYLHITSEFDILSTDRRYPQILISDQPPPVQDNLVNGTTLVVQPKGFSPSFFQVQICDHRNWDVNDQCPLLPSRPSDFAAASAVPGELTGTDHALKVDVFVSTRRLYVLLDGKPYSCSDLSAVAEDGVSHAPPSGEVTVTWGDVLYHSAVDFATGGGPIEGNSYAFHRSRMHLTARRHFDNIGFVSGSDAPLWDETLYPCVGSTP
jgi:hypothetical protein